MFMRENSALMLSNEKRAEFCRRSAWFQINDGNVCRAQGGREKSLWMERNSGRNSSRPEHATVELYLGYGTMCNVNIAWGC